MCVVICDLSRIPLLPLKKGMLPFSKPVNRKTCFLTSCEFLEAIKQGYKCHKIHKVFLFPENHAGKRLNQEDVDRPYEYYTRLFGNLWKPIALSECKHDDNRRQDYKLKSNSLSETFGKKEI
jgi:hypothetical protein